MRRRTASDLSIQAKKRSIASTYVLHGGDAAKKSETSTVLQLKEWRRQFERGESKRINCGGDEFKLKLENSPINSLASDDEGYTYIFEENNKILSDLDSPKAQALRSSSITDIGGGTHLHAIVIANNENKMRNILKPLLEDIPEAKDLSYKKQLLVYSMLSDVDATGSTPLFFCKSAVMCDLLLSAGADPNHRSKGALTPLHRASLFARVDVVCRLLEGGARGDMLDDRGRSALDASKERWQKTRHKNNRRLKAVIMLLESDEEERRNGGNSNLQTNRTQSSMSSRCCCIKTCNK